MDEPRSIIRDACDLTKLRGAAVTKYEILDQIEKPMDKQGIAGTNLSYDEAVELVRRHKMQQPQQPIKDEPTVMAVRCFAYKIRCSCGRFCYVEHVEPGWEFHCPVCNTFARVTRVAYENGCVVELNT